MVLSNLVNEAVKGVGHPELALSPAEAKLLDFFGRNIEKYVWIIVALIVGAIILPRVIIILRASRGKSG